MLAQVGRPFGSVTVQGKACKRRHERFPCFQPPCSGAFRVNRLYAADAGGQDLKGCKGAAFSAGKVPADLRAQLDCVWPSYAGAQQAC